ncbi:MAG TPA: nuclear transport factor 2 family protein [Rhizomicrobium sp.]|nr:nuclear transport factor 2 family protein [Rhizomicrobium sp.]
MKTFLAIAILACCATAANAAPCAKDGAPEIKAVYDRWLAAYRAHDLDGTMSIFAADVVFQFQGAPDASWQDLKASYAQEFASKSAGMWSPEFRSIEVSDDLAAAFSEWRLVENGTAKAHNNSIDLFRRDAACHWHIVRSLNYPLKDK